MLGDLHLHTRLSDGSSSTHEVLEFARRAKIDCISITNHDCITPLEDILPLAKQMGIKLIDGAEISSIDPSTHRRVHILCYMPKKDKEIREICAQTVKNRQEVGLEMAQKVARLYPITCQDVLEIAKDSTCIYKQHIGIALMNAGFTTQIFGELYDDLLGFAHGSCILSCKSPSVYDVIEAVRQSGGKCIMAHPYTYDSIDILNKLLADNLLDGVEVWSGKSSKPQEEYLLALAKQYNVIPTGGSDFHGAYASRVSPIGAKPTPDESIKALLMI